MSDITNAPGSMPTDAQNAIQAAAMNNAIQSKTAPAAQNQSYIGNMSNRDINSAATQMKIQKDLSNQQMSGQPMNTIKTNPRLQSMISPNVTAPTAPVISQQNIPTNSITAQSQPVGPQYSSITPINQNKSLNMNMTPNATGSMVKLPTGENLETSSMPPPNGIGSDIKDSKGNSVGYGPKTQADFAAMFKADPAIISKGWISGAEGNLNPTPQDIQNVASAMDAIGYKYTPITEDGGKDALNQWRTLRNSAAQSSLALYNQSGGKAWGIPPQVLSDGSMGRKLYSVPQSNGGNMPQKQTEQSPVQSEESKKTYSSDSNSEKPQITMQDVSNFLKKIPLQDIGNVIGDFVGQGSRGKLAYAGDFNFRTPQELRQMAQNQRESDILKNRGLLGNEYEFQSAMNAPGGPNAQGMVNTQNILKNPEQETAKTIANTQIKPGMAQAANQLPVAAIQATNGLAGLQYMKDGSVRIPPEKVPAIQSLLSGNHPVSNQQSQQGKSLFGRNAPRQEVAGDTELNPNATFASKEAAKDVK